MCSVSALCVTYCYIKDAAVPARTRPSTNQPRMQCAANFGANVSIEYICIIRVYVVCTFVVYLLLVLNFMCLGWCDW